MSEIREGKHIFKSIVLGANGALRLPEEAVEKFGVKTGDEWIVVGEENRGIGIARKTDELLAKAGHKHRSGNRKYLFGEVTVEEDGTIRLPQEATDTFGLKEGDELMVLGDESKGLAIVRAAFMKKFAMKILETLKLHPED